MCEEIAEPTPAFEPETSGSYAEPEEAISEPTHEEPLQSSINELCDDYVPEREGFEIGELISSAWQLTSGTKGSFWLGIVIMYLVLIALGMVAGLFGTGATEGEMSIGEVVIECVISAVSSLFTAGLIMMGINRARYEEVHWRDVTSGFSRALQIVIAALLQTVLITIGFILLIVPGIYLMVGYALTMGLIIDKDLSAWEAMEMSRKTIHRVWWKFFGSSLK